MSLKEQVEQAKRQIATWPKWMRDAADDIARPCTCHPADDPPVPCAQRYALQDCKASEAPR